MTALIERDYPGFTEKTKDKILYNYLKNNLTEKSKATDGKKCMPLLQEYLSFFRDSHLFFLGQASYLKTSKAEKKENIRIDKKLLASVSRSSDSLEGIWKNENFKIGIVKKKNRSYQGFIITSIDSTRKPGDILFTMDDKKQLKYINKDLTVYEDNYQLKDASTLFFLKIRSYFIKDNPDKKEATEIKDNINKLLGFSVEKLTSKTTYIKLKGFDYPFVSRIKELIDANKALIEVSENLIIDLRDNGGGTTNAFEPLLPYIMTGKTRSMNNEFWISEFFISGLENYLKKLPDDKKNQAEREDLSSRLEFYKKNRGKFVLNPGTKKAETHTFEPLIKSPAQIIFLVNNKVGSSAESLLMLAKQSKKVKLMGTPSQGLLDYANAYMSGYEYDGLPLIIPTYRSLRLPAYPVDNIGIQPDIFLDSSAGDWIQSAIEYVEH